MAQPAPRAVAPPPPVDGGGLVLGPANITVVRTAVQLKQAVVERAQDIEIREHLDLTPLLGGRGPFLDTPTEEYLRTAIIDPLALVLLEVGTRTFRGNCSNPDAASALDLLKPGPRDAPLLPLKPFQCMLLLPDTFLAVEKGRVWVDNLYLKFQPKPQQVLRHFKRTPSIITVGRLLQNNVADDYSPASKFETPAKTNLHLTDITFQGDDTQGARGVYLSGFATESTVYISDCVFTDWSGRSSPLVISRLGSGSIIDSVFRNMNQSAEIVDVSYGGLVRFENVLFADAGLPDMHVVGTSMNDYQHALFRGYDDIGIYYATDDENYDITTAVLPADRGGVFDADHIVEMAVMSDCLFLEYEENDTMPQPGCPPESIQARQVVAARMNNPNATIEVVEAAYYEPQEETGNNSPLVFGLAVPFSDLNAAGPKPLYDYEYVNPDAERTYVEIDSSHTYGDYSYGGQYYTDGGVVVEYSPGSVQGMPFAGDYELSDYGSDAAYPLAYGDAYSPDGAYVYGAGVLFDYGDGAGAPLDADGGDASYEYVEYDGEPYSYLEAPFAAERLEFISKQNIWFAGLQQVLPQRPAPPPQWPPFEVAPTPPRSLSQSAPDLDLLSESSVAGGHGSRYPNSAIVVACTLTVTVALLLAAAYTCSKYFDAKRSSVDATQVSNCNNQRLKPAFHYTSCQMQSAMNTAYNYVLPSHLALYYKTLEMTGSNNIASSRCLVDEDLSQLSNTLTSFKREVPEDIHCAYILPFPPSPRSRMEPAGSRTSMLAGKTEPAPSLMSGYRSSRCEQGPMQQRSASAVIQRDDRLCALTASYSEGSTVVAAPYSVGSTSMSTNAPQIEQVNCKSPNSEANSAVTAERPSLQNYEPKCTKSFEISQPTQPVWGNHDSQSRDCYLFLRSGVVQRSSQALVPGPCERPDRLEATCGDQIVSRYGAATRMGDLQSESTGKEAASMRLQKQLDLFHEDYIFLGRFTMLGRDHRRRGGQAVIQFAECTDDYSEYAIKFFLDRESFLTEAALYAACLPAFPADSPECATADNLVGSILPTTAGSDELHVPEAVARCLPQLEAVVDCEAVPLMDPCGRPLPSCIVMEKGDSLHDWIDRAEPDIFTTLAILTNVCERLMGLHVAGYVHRDLKPANAMWLPRQNRWTLIDFGSIARIGTKASLNFTFTYAAPEVITAFAAGELDIEASPALDAWSLGVMAFELLTGAPAFKLLTHGALLAVSMLKGDLPLPWEEGLSKQQRQQLGLFKDPIMQLLQRDPGERSDMLTFRNACNKLFAAATSAPGDN